MMNRNIKDKKFNNKFTEPNARYRQVKKYGFIPIFLALVIAFMMFFTPTRNFFLGVFGYAVYPYIISSVLIGLGMMSGKLIAVPKSKLILYGALYFSGIITLHVGFCKPYILGGLNSYITSAYLYHNTVGGALISVFTFPVGLFGKSFSLPLVFFFLLTAVLGLIAIFPSLFEKPGMELKEKKSKKPKALKSSRRQLIDTEPGKIYMEDFDKDDTFTAETDFSSSFAVPGYQNPKDDAWKRLYPEENVQPEPKSISKTDPSVIFAGNVNPNAIEDKFSKYGSNYKFYTNSFREQSVKKNFNEAFGTPEEEDIAKWYSPILDEEDSIELFKDYSGSYKEKSYKAEKKEPQVPINTIFNNSKSFSSSVNEVKPKFIGMEDKIDEDSYSPFDENEDEYIPSSKTEAKKYDNFDQPSMPESILGNVEPTKPAEVKKRTLIPVTKSGFKVEEIKMDIDETDNKKITFNKFAAPYMAPSVGLLNDIIPKTSDDAEDPTVYCSRIEETFNKFGIPATVRSLTKGPTFTRFEITVPDGIQVNRLMKYEKDLRYHLKVKSIRMEAPIPGMDAVGVEVPNQIREVVSLKSVMSSKEFNEDPNGMTLCYGKTVSGACFVRDLVKMSHLLVAGATNTGKSVCLNSLLLSLIYKHSPDEVRFIMVDPKRVELSAYNNLPHMLIGRTVCEDWQAVNALQWATEEMTRRYNFLESVRCQKISDYNDQCKKNKQPLLPRIIIVVDEMAELMSSKHRQSVEECIKRIAQMGRAAGIHLIIATQRPSVDVVTGIIKANILNTIAFTVKSFVDSKTILDASGAENLLGAGDMLFNCPEETEFIRIQGTYVSNAEIKAVTDYVREHNEAKFDEEVANLIFTPKQEQQGTKNAVSTYSASLEDEGEDIGTDPLLYKAMRIFIEEGKVSISLLQRKFAIGYNRSARIVDILQEKGMVSGQEGSKGRSILISMDELDSISPENE